MAAQIISGTYRGYRLITPKNISTRPTTSRLKESFFNICQNKVQASHFLDVFAGSGAIGLEALSRGAAHVTFIDHDKAATDTIKKNLHALEISPDKYRVLQYPFLIGLKTLKKAKSKFHLIYADPPYAKQLKDENPLSLQMLKLLDQYSLLDDEGSVFIEENYRYSLTLAAAFSLQLHDKRKIGDASLYCYRAIASQSSMTSF